MKTGAPILVSFAVGALVVLGLHVRSTAVAASGPRPAGGIAAPRVEPVPAPTRTVRRERVAERHRVGGPAQVAIPVLHLKARIGTHLDVGPAWWPVTGRPGSGDTVAIAGHRTTHTHPFLDLDRLSPGNAIYVRWRGSAYRYVVTGTRVVSSRQQHIADARGREVLILTTCTPKGSSRQRLVIYAQPTAHSES